MAAVLEAAIILTSDSESDTSLPTLDKLVKLFVMLGILLVE